MDVSGWDAAGGAGLRLARRRRSRRCVLGTVGALEYRARAIRHAAQSIEGRELLARGYLRFVRAAARRSLVVDGADQGAQRRQMVPAGRGVTARRYRQGSRRVGAFFHEWAVRLDD